jgi:hypothetical protein
MTPSALTKLPVRIGFASSAGVNMRSFCAGMRHVGLEAMLSCRAVVSVAAVGADSTALDLAGAMYRRKI